MYLKYLIKNAFHYLRSQGFLFVIREFYRYIKKTIYIPYLLYFLKKHEPIADVDQHIKLSFDQFVENWNQGWGGIGIIYYN